MTGEGTHEPRDQAAAYVLDALEPDERRAFERALERSPELRREVAELREVVGLLASGAPPVPRDDDALKAELLKRIRDPARAVPRERRRSVPAYVGWAAAAPQALAAGVQTARVMSLDERLRVVERASDSLNASLARREATLNEILGPSTRLILLAAPGERPPGIQLFWNQVSGRVVLHAFNLPRVAAGREYQLWFLRDGGVEPGGTFNADPDGHALVTLPGPPSGIAVRGAAVTEEPAGGSPQPTSAIIVSGTTGE